MNSKVSFLALLSLASLVSCGRGQSPQVSSLSDVVSPGDLNDTNSLFWIDQDQAFKGDCAVGAPATRENCQTKVIKMAVTALTQGAGAVYSSKDSSLQTQIAAEVKLLKESDPTVKELTTQIGTLTAMKADLEKATASEANLLKTKTDAKAVLDKQLAFVTAQLAEIEKALAATPNDTQLQKLRMDRLDEKQSLTVSIAQAADEIAELTAVLAWHNGELDNCKKSLADTQAKLKTTYDALKVSSPNLNALKASLAFTKKAAAEVENVVGLMKVNAISFKSNLFSAERQDALKTLSSSFVIPTPIKEGRYEVLSGYTNFCPQRLQIKAVQGVLQTVTTTYLSPCGGGSTTHSCSKLVCQSSSATVTILSESKYEYRESSTRVAVFAFKSPSLDADFVENGPFSRPGE
jgi:hypothetical protein